MVQTRSETAAAVVQSADELPDLDQPHYGYAPCQVDHVAKIRVDPSTCRTNEKRDGIVDAATAQYACDRAQVVALYCIGGMSNRHIRTDWTMRKFTWDKVVSCQFATHQSSPDKKIAVTHSFRTGDTTVAKHYDPDDGFKTGIRYFVTERAAKAEFDRRELQRYVKEVFREADHERRVERVTLITGVYREYDHDTGELIKTVPFENGWIEGVASETFQGGEGRCHWQYNYDHGSPHGLQTCKNDAGNVTMTEMYDHGKRDGDETHYSGPDPSVVTTRIAYKAGVRQLNELFHDCTGKIVTRERYRGGKPHGLTEKFSYTGDGEIVRRVPYAFGKIQGSTWELVDVHGFQWSADSKGERCVETAEHRDSEVCGSVVRTTEEGRNVVHTEKLVEGRLRQVMHTYRCIRESKKRKREYTDDDSDGDKSFWNRPCMSRYAVAQARRLDEDDGVEGEESDGKPDGDSPIVSSDESD